jgi:hypothetical protein
MTWMPYAILGGVLLEALTALIARYAAHLDVFEIHPEFRLFSYGTRTTYYSPADGRPSREWFFILKLPSWQYGQFDYSRRWGWLQLCWIWTSTNGWSEWWQPCPEQWGPD